MQAPDPLNEALQRQRLLEDTHRRGVTALQGGDLPGAVDLFKAASEMDPLNPLILNNLGVAQLALGRAEDAEGSFERALSLRPEYAGALNNRGNALRSLGRHAEALASYESAIASASDFVDAYVNRGSLLSDLDHKEAALSSFDQAIAIRRDHAGAYAGRGNVALSQQSFAAAAADFERALCLQPANADLHYNHGNALLGLDKPEAAIASFDRAIALRPDYANALNNRGNAFRELGQFDLALSSYRAALRHESENVDAHNNCGVVLLATSRLDDALVAFDRALGLRSDFVEAWVNRAATLSQLGRPDDALAALDRALALQPRHCGARNSRGVILQTQGRLHEALANHDATIASNPDDAQAHANRGKVLLDLLHIEPAIANFERAIALSHDCAEARFNRACAQLLSGDFRRGWAEYEWRDSPLDPSTVSLRRPTPRRNLSQPRWRGDEPIAGKTILLYAEQGLGDALQFCRYGPLVAAQGATVILEVWQPLVELLRTLPGVTHVIPFGGASPRFDLHCPLMSLPLAFRTELSSIPAQRSYLRADPVRVERWRGRLGSGTNPRVGIAWSGNPKHPGDAQRSIPLAKLLSNLPPDIRLVTLQRDASATDRRTIAERRDIIDVSAELVDFAETAALCECLDLIVSVDTSTAHLSAALGRPTWILLPHCPDWRWLLVREDSPWYPSVRLYRQAVRGDWGDPLQRLSAHMAVELAAIANET